METKAHVFIYDSVRLGRQPHIYPYRNDSVKRPSLNKRFPLYVGLYSLPGFRFVVESKKAGEE